MKKLVDGGAGGALTVFATTHHSILTTLAYTDPWSRFENASVEFDDRQLAPTYRLLWGVPGRSCALGIASRLGMPGEIIADARSRLGSDETAVSSIIAQLEVRRGVVLADSVSFV